MENIVVPTTVLAEKSKDVRALGRTDVVHPFFDFWLLGGLSIAIFVTMALAEIFRADSGAVQSRFMQIGIAFGFLTLICNHPHFIISYRFGYGRGWKFILKNWFSLIVIPTTLMVAYTIAYFFFDTPISELPGIATFPIENSETLGVEIMRQCKKASIP